MTRFATRKQRAALWRSSGGLCAICGEPVGHDFHADHKDTPWSVGHVTNIHDMQVLCAKCNTRKGSNMYRMHQRRALEIANLSGCGTDFKHVLASVTPGGGKSALPVIFAERMISRGIAEKICWVVPRDSLRRQAERAFLDKTFRSLLGHSREIRAAGNDVNPARGLDGYVTTYQAIATDPDLHRDEFSRHRYVLALDELHHSAVGSIWHKALEPLVSKAALILMMSGTLSRADRWPISFLDYDLQGSPITSDTEKTRVINYSRQNALSEKAILPIFFERMDGRAKWVDTDGEEREVASLAGAGDDTGAALYTSLRQEYAFELLRSMLESWKHYSSLNRRSKFLVVAPTISLAKAYLKRIRDLGFDDVDIATSEDSDEARTNIDRLKGHKTPSLRGLVTVGMAYEGLDCPEITHIACLTHIRSHEWIEQMLARATRVDYGAGDYFEQGAYVWAPDDDLFSEAIALIQAEQAPFIREADDDLLGDRDGTGGGGGAREQVIPLDAAATVSRASDMQTGEVIDGQEYRRLKQIAQDAGLGFLSPAQVKKLAEALVMSDSAEAVAEAVTDTNLTASEREAALRRELDKRVKRVCQGDGDRIKYINKMLIRRFRKSRDEMLSAELKEAFAFIEQFSPGTEKSDVEVR